MSIIYLDTSALGRVLLGEPDAPVILRALAAFDGHVASRLLRVELRRLAFRVGLMADAEKLLAGVALIPVEQSLLDEAERVEPSTVATLDALHLACALRLANAGQLDAMMTYDMQLAEGARHHFIPVIAPAN